MSEPPSEIDNRFLSKQVSKLNEPKYSLWELYEIHSSLPRKFVPYGTWDSINGLEITTEKKWFRRQNLEVIMSEENFCRN